MTLFELFQMYSRSAVRAFLARPSAYKRPAVNSSTAAVFQVEPKPPVEGVMQVREDKIVGRDIVGYGLNGEPIYFDSITYPFPSVRFMKNTPEILVLKYLWRIAPLLQKNVSRCQNGRHNRIVAICFILVLMINNE